MRHFHFSTQPPRFQEPLPGAGGDEFFCVKYLCHAFGNFQFTQCIEFPIFNSSYNTNWSSGRRECINLQSFKGKNVQNSFGDVKTGKTSRSARINIWINPGFLMQSGALAIPSAECRLLDELSKPQQLKEINWNPPPPLLHFLPSAHSKSSQQHEMEAHSCVK